MLRFGSLRMCSASRIERASAELNLPFLNRFLLESTAKSPAVKLVRRSKRVNSFLLGVWFITSSNTSEDCSQLKGRNSTLKSIRRRRAFVVVQ